VFDVTPSDREPWGQKVMNILSALACRPGFSFVPSSSSAMLPDKVLGHGGLSPRFLGCGELAVVDNDLGNSRSKPVDINAVDVLRCMLAAFSETLCTANPWRRTSSSAP
jgi:hypothetical protein